MAGSATSEIIIFIAALSAAAALAGVMTATSGDYAGALLGRAENRAAALDTQVAIVNDPEAVATDPLVLYVLNTGTRTLDAERLVVLVDGQVESDVTASIIDDTGTLLAPGQVAELTVNVVTASGDHRVTILTPDGPTATFSFFQP